MSNQVTEINCCSFVLESDKSEYEDRIWKITKKIILEKLFGMVWTGWNWFRVGPKDEFSRVAAVASDFNSVEIWKLEQTKRH
jgi:hypothetical protein